MAYKLMAVDMDGTLLNNKNEISPATAASIKKAVDSGLVFCLCTGRPLQGVTKYLQELELDGPVITYNGAMIVRSDTKEILFEQKLEREDARKILALGRRYGTTMCIWSAGKLYGNVLNERIHEYKKMSGLEPVLVENEEALLDQGITKILWYDTVEMIQKTEREIPKDTFENVTFCTSKPFFLEFFNSKSSKASAMENLGLLLSISREEMIAVGDGFNDLPMIRYAGLGVAMENAPAEVKAQADYITADNEHDGVGKVIEKFVLHT